MSPVARHCDISDSPAKASSAVDSLLVRLLVEPDHVSESIWSTALDDDSTRSILGPLTSGEV